MKGIVQLYRDLGIKTIAEMVETQKHATQLRAMGVEFGQGWLFGRPERTPTLPRDIRRVLRRRGVTETWM
jgi:EAL domain-containing protein (putative c-di-GMP-specific phosphodiesterase class I)